MPWNQVDVMKQKEEFVLAALREAEPFATLCRRYGISTVTGYYWRQRFLAEGRVGLEEKSRRPRGHPEQLQEGVICELVRLKRQYPVFGPEKVRWVFERTHGRAPSLSSVKRVLAKAGLVETRKVRRRMPPGQLPRRAWEAQAPNEVWSADLKGWWLTDSGRCEPLTVRDCCTRYVLGVQAMATNRTEAVRAQFERWFEQYGLPEVIHTDNGSPFASTHAVLGLSRLSAWWVALGIRLSRSRPGHPEDNGGHERMHRDLEEAVQPGIERAGSAAQAILDQWRHEFNHVRPHRALDMKCPAELYVRSSREYDGTPERIDYGSDFTSRKVSAAGSIRVDGQLYFVSQALAGWNVGLRATAAQGFEVWFDHLLLGELQTTAARFIWASPDKAPAP